MEKERDRGVKEGSSSSSTRGKEKDNKELDAKEKEGERDAERNVRQAMASQQLTQVGLGGLEVCSYQ